PDPNLAFHSLVHLRLRRRDALPGCVPRAAGRPRDRRGQIPALTAAVHDAAEEPNTKPQAPGKLQSPIAKSRLTPLYAFDGSGLRFGRLMFACSLEFGA